MLFTRRLSEHVTKHFRCRPFLLHGIALTALAGADGVASEISITVCACATTSPVCRVVNPTRIRVHLGIEMRVHDVRFEALLANVHHVQGSTQRWDVLLAPSSVP